MLATLTILLAAGLPNDIPVSDRLAEVGPLGNFGKSAAEFEDWSRDEPDNDNIRAAAGMLRFFSAVELLNRGFYRYGATAPDLILRPLQVPIPTNPDPEPFTYELSRRLAEQSIDNMTAAARLLADVKDPDVAFIVPLGQMKFDFTGDGTAETPLTTFVAAAMNGGRSRSVAKWTTIKVDADRADVAWLLGYTHVLRAMAEGYLAYDGREFFDAIAPRLFAGVPHPLAGVERERLRRDWQGILLDAAVAVKSCRFTPREPARLKMVHKHLRESVDRSRECWTHTLKETDDAREWLPGPGQTSVIPLSIGKRQVDAWRLFLDETDAVLDGKRLIPHWRLKRTHGINLKKILEEAPTLDLIDWSHGRGVLPFVEEGEVVSAETVDELDDAFGGRFLSFAAWIN